MHIRLFEHPFVFFFHFCKGRNIHTYVYSALCYFQYLSQCKYTYAENKEAEKNPRSAQILLC